MSIRFRTSELDPDLLSTAFRVRTRWNVITGAPSCGKTTLIDLMARRGFLTVPETAREYMQSEVAAGRTLGEIHADGQDLQRHILDLQVSVERGLQASALVFLDGSLPGSLSWYRVFGLDPNEVLPRCFEHRYASVFVLDRLPHRRDGFRFDDDVHAVFLDEWIACDHEALGYEVVRVPVLPPEERLSFVLENLGMSSR